MPDIAEPTAVVGGLVVLNGRHAGSRVPLRLPVTLIGTGPGCDVRLTAAGVEDVHCMILATPAGPAVRSLFPGATQLNGTPTAAALLRHHDELTVGPCGFRITWAGGTPRVEQAGGTPAVRAADDFHLREREQAVHEQEHQLAALIEERQKQVQGLLDQLAEGRDQLRAERAAVAAEKADATAKADAARRAAASRKADRARTRKAAARLLRRMRAKSAAEWSAAAEARSAAERDRQALTDERDRLAAEWDRGRAESEAHAGRLNEAWAMLADAQDRLAAERTQTEAELSQLFQLLDARSAAAAEGEQAAAAGELKLTADRRAFDEQTRAVRAEVAGLEQRAFHLRLALQELEQKRAGLSVAAAGGGFVPEAIPVMDPISLDEPDARSADEVLALLQFREKELEQERKAVADARAELDRLAEELADGRRVLAEQFDRLADTRRDWQQVGVDAAAELEEAARELDDRERTVCDRESAADRADAARRDRERDVWQLQARLDRWQAALAAHEARFAADAQQAEADLAARRERAAEREAELAEVGRVWGVVRTQERKTLAAELTRCADERTRFAAGLADFDRKREELLADAGRVAGLAVALEEARQAWEKVSGPKAARRLRVLRERWEGRFRRYAADLARRREALTAEAAALDDRRRELNRLLADTADPRADHSPRPAAGPADDADAVVILSLSDARRAKAEDELAAARAEAERLSASLRGADARRILPLRPAA